MRNRVESRFNGEGSQREHGEGSIVVEVTATLGQDGRLAAHRSNATIIIQVSASLLERNLCRNS